MTELAALCPFTELTDTEMIWFDYPSQTKLVELEFKKYFYYSFHNVRVNKKYVKSWICNGLSLLQDPEELLTKKIQFK